MEWKNTEVPLNPSLSFQTKDTFNFGNDPEDTNFPRLCTVLFILSGVCASTSVSLLSLLLLRETTPFILLRNPVFLHHSSLLLLILLVLSRSRKPLVPCICKTVILSRLRIYIRQFQANNSFCAFLFWVMFLNNCFFVFKKNGRYLVGADKFNRKSLTLVFLHSACSLKETG